MSVTRNPIVESAAVIEAAPDDLALGKTIRTLRQARRLSLKDVAEPANVSVGQLSQIERGLSSPSIRALRSICGVLGVPVHALFQGGDAVIRDEARRIVRVDQRRRLHFGAKGMVKEFLTPDEDGSLQVMEVILEPDAGSGDEAYTHEGEECGVVLQGRLELHVDGTTYRLGEGDAFRFESHLPHRFRNVARGTTRALWIVTPPVY